jgi:hypothetical protein
MDPKRPLRAFDRFQQRHAALALPVAEAVDSALARFPVIGDQISVSSPRACERCARGRADGDDPRGHLFERDRAAQGEEGGLTGSDPGTR